MSAEAHGNANFKLHGTIIPSATVTAAAYRDLTTPGGGNERVAHQPTKKTGGTRTRPAVVLIEPRRFTRDCLAQCLGLPFGGDMEIVPAASVADWLAMPDRSPRDLIILSVGNIDASRSLDRDLQDLTKDGDGPPVLVLADTEDTDEIFRIMSRGVKGFIPTSLPYPVILEAMRLVRAGGTFVPATAFMASCRNPDAASSPKVSKPDLLTSRELSVIEALRQGKPNKSIAYELNLCESTVKVHVRRIMKKLNAKNRTQLAVLASQMA